jgi:hypothetical protein
MRFVQQVVPFCGMAQAVSRTSDKDCFEAENEPILSDIGLRGDILGIKSRRGPNRQSTERPA